MIKKFSKIILITMLLLILSLSSFTCFADEEHEHNHNESSETITTENNTTVQPEVHYGDLYLLGNNIVMDKLVDGNVFILGTNVEITGQVNGNLFILANTVSYNGACNDLYVLASKLDLSYNSFVARDLKAISSSVIIKSFIQRDVDLLCNTLNIGNENETPIILGDLRYTANKEITIPEGVLLSGSATYTNLNSNHYSNITDVLIEFTTCIVTVLAIFIILKKLTPKFIEKTYVEKFSLLKLLKAFGIGLATILAVILLFILLIVTSVGINLAFILALLFALLSFIAVPTLIITITNSLKPTLKIEKISMFYLVLSLISIIFYGVTLIPYIGGFIGFIINVIAIGLIVLSYIPHKELTDEEKLELEEAKKQAKDNKEKRKQEKLEAKEIKNKKKLDLKENKKKGNND